MESLSIRACAAQTGVSPDTLRYYEKIGLLSRVPRSSRGHRQFGEAELRWIVFLRRLHDTGMPIRRMQQYARLLRRGDATRAERRALLEAHREEVRARLALLNGHLKMIDKKIRLYADAELSQELAPGAKKPGRPPRVLGGAGAAGQIGQLGQLADDGRV